ncbi:FAD-dependent oxidoreductase [Vibrio sp. JC009]|uniref:NAD(P)/FAD-dependent oxidoreductase n=1 Tax=Vibrio sp. JC009 TaxID=2912314 RepID=UPI0023AEA1A6|nr:FAD-dependent oxidoreductase [Vibrio sp. JC009]WED22725.1 FAD-dependent oxidoreductase [Vibrio sp. JC009]
MKIAIIGTGISGLTAGYYLHRHHDITLFEANSYIGGHTATVDVEVDGRNYAVDTGFIVYNGRTYPNFINLMNEIGVEGVPTQMSFSVRNDANGLEYNGHTLSTLFAQKKNWLNPQFYQFIREIIRFNRLAKESISYQSSHALTLGDFLKIYDFSDYFAQNYILPMGAAIWSSTIADMRVFPLDFFLRFFLNHGLLDVANRPQWYVIKGGSREYIQPLTKGFGNKIRLNTSVEKVWRIKSGVVIRAGGRDEHFDQVIFSCHSDQALRILADCSPYERQILSDIRYQENEVTLHLDTSLLPIEQKAWASWNYHLADTNSLSKARPTLTYNMNILQHIQSSHTFCVSLNSQNKIDQSKILRSFIYDHPLFERRTIKAQKRRDEINGARNTWFCGAYWYNGFHEDGVRSAIDVVSGLEESVNTPNQQKGAA